MNAQCPECESWIPVPHGMELWDNLACPRCYTELRLISDSPPSLDYADYDELDDEYDDDDFDYLDEFGEDIFEPYDEKED
jgi:hypothetical protein